MFQIGFNIVPSFSKDSLLCFNQNYKLENLGNNQYYRVDEFNLIKKEMRMLYDKTDGPRYRITNVNIGYKKDNRIHERK
jgi:hypothetical protein